MDYEKRQPTADCIVARLVPSWGSRISLLFKATEPYEHYYDEHGEEVPNAAIVSWTDVELPPEESEDEEIRKHIIDIIKDNAKSKCIPCDAEIAYLEKQKESHYSPLCNTIKDKIREYIANHFIADTVVKTDMKSIVKAMEEGVRLGMEEQKPKFYPGDVIKCTSTGSLWVRCKDRDNIRSDGHTACIGGGFELASEEEAVHFFQELNENGYQWDCIKGRPMKKEQKPIFRIGDTLKKEGKEYTFTIDKIQGGFYLTRDEHFFPIEEQDTWELVEQQPAEWSDNFEENIRNLLHEKLKQTSNDGSMSSAVFIDDKTLKDIVSGIWFYVGKEALKYPDKQLNVGQKSAKWSDEDEERLGALINYFEGDALDYSTEDMVRWLKSLRPQPHWKQLSEKDTLGRDKCYVAVRDSDLSDEEKEWAFNFLKRCEPKSHWKPSEEQMNAMRVSYSYWRGITNETPRINILESLYNDLKKL